jgi:hypothetical protein
MSETRLIAEALRAGEGIPHLAPCWVARSFLVPGGLKLHPDVCTHSVRTVAASTSVGSPPRLLPTTVPGTPEEEGLSGRATPTRHT